MAVLNKGLVGLALVVSCSAGTGPSKWANVLSFSIGPSHGCALTSEQVVYCWGDNHAGQLGVADLLGSSLPIAVRTHPLLVQSVLVDDDASCGELAAGGAACWGHGSPAVRPLAGSAGFSGFVAGTSVICGVSSVGAVRCWAGIDSAGVDVAGLGVVHGLVAGGVQACALAADSTAWCWNVGGVAAEASAPLKFRRLAVGGDHACGVVVDATVVCWGSNQDGQLGVGDTYTHAGSTVVTGLPNGDTVDDVAAGMDYTCVVMSDHSAGCWGADGWAQLGVGYVAVPGLDQPTGLVFQPGWAAIFAGGGTTTCARAISETIYCWGRNDAGQVGSGDTVRTVTEPEAVFER